MWSVNLIIAWMGFVGCYNFARGFHRLGSKKDVYVSWKYDAAGSIVAAIIAAALIFAWFKGW